MRILTVSNLYPPAYVGGYELMCREVMEKLSMLEHEVRVLTSNVRLEDVNPSAAAGQSQQCDCSEVMRLLRVEQPFGTIRKTTPVNLLERIKSASLNKRILEEAVESFSPDIIFFWSLLNISRSVILQAREMDIPTAFYISDPLQFDPDSLCRTLNNQYSSLILKPARRVITRALVKRRLVVLPQDAPISNVIYSCKAVLEEGRRRGIGQFGAVVVPHGVNMRDFTGTPERRWYDGSRPLRIMYASRIAFHKGMETLILAMKMLSSPGGPQVEALIYNTGDPGYVTHVKRLIHENNLDRVFAFRGMVDTSKLPTEMGNADVFVLPSIPHAGWFESWSVVLAQAGAAGMAAVASRSGANAELITEGETGLLFNPDDAEGLASCIRALAADPQTVRRMGEALAVLVRERYTLEKMASQIERHLCRVIEQRVSGNAGGGAE
ncbi:MAG TPA: glycosyltransferase family 4 protein [Candidatus Brocadiia bacterium]|nr:glycosyltransferase family 4 protein [Candidatus Brocadiia bacterium]